MEWRVFFAQPPLQGNTLLGVWLLLLPVPILVAGVVYIRASRRDDNHAVAWAVATFAAGIGNGGMGSIVVGLLYSHLYE